VLSTAGLNSKTAPVLDPPVVFASHRLSQTVTDGSSLAPADANVFVFSGSMVMLLKFLVVACRLGIELALESLQVSVSSVTMADGFLTSQIINPDK
jgi:hypothetical protein